MNPAHTRGSLHASNVLGLMKTATLRELEDLATPSLFNKLERLFVPPQQVPTGPIVSPTAVINREKAFLKKRYNITAHLTGSMPLGLAIPGDVDIDLFVRAESPGKFKSIIRKLQDNPTYTTSPHNKAGAGYFVFQRDAQDANDYPVDLAVAYGDSAREYKTSLQTQKKRAKELPAELRERLVSQKYLLRNTPFDVKAKRYKSFKRGLESALGGGYRLDRELVSDLTRTAQVIDLKDEKQLASFRSFTSRNDMYGHRTHNLDAVLESKGLLSALEALKRGKLKSFEAGASVGSHQAVEYNALNKSQLANIEKEMFTESPNTSVFDEVSKATGRSKDAVKADFLRQKFNKIKTFLKRQKDPEGFRKKHFSISKLGPNIFVTKGGVLNSDAYGDSALLVRSRTAKKSPFMNLLTDEHIIPSKGVLEPRKLRIGSGYVVTPKANLKRLDKRHPHVKFVATEDIPADLKKSLYKSPRSLKEVWHRWVPSLLSGDLRRRQTH